jgi:mRNA-degrading endonuclease RelE of RelBE toxin-antitoxin system
MKWDVQFANKASKQADKLGENISLTLQLLVENLKSKGPAPGSHWQNYSKLHAKKNEDNRHCHLIKGNPTYVCCWRVDKKNKYIEVYYVGTHEKAPY